MVLSDAQIENLPMNSENARIKADHFLKNLRGYPEQTYSGRGIVIAGGSIKYFTCAWICINMLRHNGCQLPIQVWYLGREEMDDRMEALLAPLGVECIDASKVRERHPARILNGWEAKPYSILYSPWKEVLLLDADNVPLIDPESLFHTPEFEETGAVFWPDYGRLGPDREIWKTCGLEYRDEPEFESGQILIDKEKCWEALNLTMWINEHSDFYYSQIHGDKETYHMAWHMVEKAYSMVPTPIHTLRDTMCQHNFQGKRIFQHRNLAKWKIFGENPRINDFWMEELCFDFLNELKGQWDGYIQPPLRDWSSYKEKDMANAARELATHHYTYHRVGYDKRLMRFQPDGLVGEGRAGMEDHWDLEKIDGIVHIRIHSPNSVTCKLRRDSDGVWRGNWEHFERMPIVLIPEEKLPIDPTDWQRSTLTLEAFSNKLIQMGEPMSQNTRGTNWGFGHIYYGLVRNLHPEYVVAIGSARGFMPFSLARGLQDNGWGKVLFIDPSLAGSGPPAWEGRDHWASPEKVKDWIAEFQLRGWIEHFKLTSDIAFPLIQRTVQKRPVSLVVIDGAHSFENSMRDFENYSTLIDEGFVLFHDSINPHCGVKETIQILRNRGYKTITFNQEVGLTLVEINNNISNTVERRWDHLVKPSNRSELLYQILVPYLEINDTIMDSYCGSAPMAHILRDYNLWGWDRDFNEIHKLREQFPNQQWSAIEEQQLPYADLPKNIDVLLGLGITGHHVEWDMAHSETNFRYLVARYLPRLCFFEATVEDAKSEILDSIFEFLDPIGYRCEWHTVQTDLEKYHKRRVLLAIR